jgi:hypothetical protein
MTVNTGTAQASEFSARLSVTVHFESPRSREGLVSRVDARSKVTVLACRFGMAVLPASVQASA